MKILLIVIASAALLWLLVAFVCFLIAHLRIRTPDFSNPKVLARSPFGAYTDVISAGIKWTLAQPTEPHEIMAADGVRLHADWLACPGSKRIMLLMHGWRSSPETDFAGAVQFFHEHGCNVLLVSQRAHAKSGGRFITFGAKERHDCKLWAEYISRLHPDCRVVLEGMSMGAATVLMAAGLDLPDQVCGIVADCGFTSPGDIISEVIRSTLHFRCRPLERTMELYCRIFTGTGYRDCSTLDALRSCKIPLLLVHGRKDSFVPCRMSEENRAAHGGDCELHIVEEATHGASALVEPERIYGALERFLDRVFADK